MGKRKKKKSYRGRSVAELVDLIVLSERGDAEGDAAYFEVRREIAARIQARALGEAFAAEVFNLLPSEFGPEFYKMCEQIAAQSDVKIGDAPGHLQLFAIPVHGPLDEMEEAFWGGELLSEVTNALRLTGYAAERSNVVVMADLIPLRALSLLSPPRIRDVLLDVSASFSEHNASGAVRRLYHDATEMGLEDDEGADEELNETMFGVRFLIGARVCGLEGPKDELFPDPDAPEALSEAREEAWDMRMIDLLGADSAVIIESPVCWEEARVELLTCVVRQAAEVALSVEGVEDLIAGFENVTSRVVGFEDGIEVQLLYRGRRLCEVPFDYGLTGFDLTDFLFLLDAEFPTHPDEETAVSPTLH